MPIMSRCANVHLNVNPRMHERPLYNTLHSRGCCMGLHRYRHLASHADAMYADDLAINIYVCSLSWPLITPLPRKALLLAAYS